MNEYQQLSEARLMLREVSATIKQIKRELGASKRAKTKHSLRAAADVYQQYKDLAALDHEEFWALALDNKNRVITEIRFCIGTTASCVVSTRDVFCALLRENAQQVILLHNHPSGEPEPSAEDRQITGRLKKAGDIVGVPVLDHIIIGAEGFFSLRDNNMMNDVFSI